MQDKIGSSWLRYAGKKGKKVCKIGLPRNYETQLNHEKEVQETWIRALSREFRVSELPKEIDSNPDHRQKTNIMCRCPRRLDIQKELGWDLVRHGTSAKFGEIACTSTENWNELQETCERGEATEESCLHSQRELKWSSRDLYGEELEFEDDPRSSTFFS